MDHFKTLIATSESDTDSIKLTLIHDHDFYISSILIKHLCSKNFTESSKSKSEHIITHMKALVESCVKIHKKRTKRLFKSVKNDETDQKVHKLKTSTFHIDFLKSYIYNTEKLNSLYGFEIDSVKLIQQLFKIYLNYDNNLKPIDGEEENADVVFLKRTFVFCLNSFTLENFKLILADIDSEFTDVYDSLNDNKILVKLSNMIKYISCDIDLNDKLKEEFSIYIQKVILAIIKFTSLKFFIYYYFKY